MLGRRSFPRRLSAVLVVVLLAADAGAKKTKKRRRTAKKEVVECEGKEPETDTFQVKILEAVDDDVCDLKSQVGDTLTVKFASKYFDTCEEFATNMGEEFVLGSPGPLTGWNWGLQGMCEGEVRALYLTSHDLLTPDSVHGRRAAETNEAGGEAPRLTPRKSRSVVMTVELQEIHRRNAWKGGGAWKGG